MDKLNYIKVVRHVSIDHSISQERVNAEIVPKMRAEIQADVDQFIEENGPQTIEWRGPQRQRAHLPIPPGVDEFKEYEKDGYLYLPVDETTDIVMLLAVVRPVEQ